MGHGSHCLPHPTRARSRSFFSDSKILLMGLITVDSMNITINVPDQIGLEINQLPNRNARTLHALMNMLEEYRHSLQNTDSKPSQWKNMLTEIEENKVLYRGLSEQIQKDSEDFREGFIPNEDK